MALDKRNYCAKCMHLCETARCEICGNRRLSIPDEDSPVYLVSKSAVWEGLVSDVLGENRIPFIKRSYLASAVRTPFEQFDFFVRLGNLSEAKELLEGLFASNIAETEQEIIE